MKAFFFALIIFLILTSCDSANHKEQIKDNCSEHAFTDIDSAVKCDADPENYKSLLFALVSKDVEKYESEGWNILKDEDIINTAKNDYVLIIIDPSHINSPHENLQQEFLDIIRHTRPEPYFVVTNRPLYPFRQFNLSEKKEDIIDELRIGEGP